jgi:hypothetical protein
MFTQTWKKYVPVIVILLKRSASGEQTLRVNQTDFERAAGGRKVKYSFSNLQLNKGRINTSVKHMPLARELAEVLQEDIAIKRILVNYQFEFSLSTDFILTIKNNTPAEPIGVPVPESEEATANQ